MNYTKSKNISYKDFSKVNMADEYLNGVCSAYNNIFATINSNLKLDSLKSKTEYRTFINLSYYTSNRLETFKSDEIHFETVEESKYGMLILYSIVLILIIILIILTVTFCAIKGMFI